MMIVQEDIVKIIQSAVKEVNNTLAESTPLHIEDAMVLFGEGGIFDSIALVTLIVNIEQAIQDTFNIDLLLANEKAMSQKNSPFKTIGSLSSYVMQMIEEECVA